MPRSISQLLIGATVAIGSAVVGVTAIGSATPQSPLEQAKSPPSRRSISESVIISSSETFSLAVVIDEVTVAPPRQGRPSSAEG
jgi:hypothetical protein